VFAQAAAGIERERSRPPRGVTLTARINEGVVLRQPRGSEARRAQVLDAEVAIPVGEPHLAAAAIHTAEGELVAKPGLVVLVIDVAPGPWRRTCGRLG
jgi:hypothetical protein